VSRLGLELSYAVRPRVVASSIGLLCLALAGLSAPPAIVAAGVRDVWCAAAVGGAAALLGLIGFGLTRLHVPKGMQLNEAMLATCAIFLIAPLSMTPAFMTAGLGAGDAFFEAVSAATTTGLSVAPAGEDLPGSIVFLRSWMQWYGGLGIVVLSLAIVTRSGVIARRLAQSEGAGEDLTSSVRAHARRTLTLYVALTVVGVALLLLAGASIFEAGVFALSSVSTGGFAPTGESLGGLDTHAARWFVTLGTIAGATSFIVYFRAHRAGLKALLRDKQAGGVFLIMVAATLVVAACMRAFDGMSWGETLRHAPMMAISAQTTSGFSTLDPGSLDPTSKLALIVSMTIGGEAGSTAGGIKILRLLIIFRILQMALAQASMPRHAVLTPRLGGEKLPDSEMRAAALIALLFVTAIVLGWLPFLAAGHAPVDALFEVVSALGTVGLSTGVCGTDLAWHLKGVLCAGMLLGRLEILAWLVAIHPRTWLGKRESS
jgi:trk system potassium uptake protein TrkH